MARLCGMVTSKRYYAQNVEWKKRFFDAAAGEKGISFKRPRNSYDLSMAHAC